MFEKCLSLRFSFSACIQFTVRLEQMTSRKFRCCCRTAGWYKSARTDRVRISKLLSTAQCGSMQRIAGQIQLSLLLALSGLAMPSGGTSNTPSSKSQGNLMTLRTVQESKLVPRNTEVLPSTATIFVQRIGRVSVWRYWLCSVGCRLRYRVCSLWPSTHFERNKNYCSTKH
jgi:hypothetical protein